MDKPSHIEVPERKAESHSRTPEPPKYVTSSSMSTIGGEPSAGSTLAPVAASSSASTSDLSEKGVHPSLKKTGKEQTRDREKEKGATDQDVRRDPKRRTASLVETIPGTPRPPNTPARGPIRALDFPKASDDEYFKGRRAAAPQLENKNQAYQYFFGLPESERLIDDFSCAVKGKILLHGRLYISQNFVCFFSNIFEHKTKIVIPFSDISSIKKRRFVKVFPNSIEIVTSEKKYFFASFMFRNQVFNMLAQLWTVHLKLSGKNPKDFIDSSSLKKTGKIPEPGKVEASPAPHLHGGKEEESDDSDDDSPPDVGDTIEDFSDLEEEGGGDVGDVKNLPPEMEAFVKAGPPPDMRLLLEAEFPIPLKKLFDLIFHDKSAFFEEFHHTQGDHDVLVNGWQSYGSKFGSLRDIRVRSPVSFAMGPKTTRVFITQRYRFESKKALRFEMQSYSADVPFGDSYRTESRWAFNETEDRKTKLRLEFGCRFLQKSFWQSRIRENVFKEADRAYRKWTDMAQTWIQKERDRRMSRRGGGEPLFTPSTAATVDFGVNDAPSHSFPVVDGPSPTPSMFSEDDDGNGAGEMCGEKDSFLATLRHKTSSLADTLSKYNPFSEVTWLLIKYVLVAFLAILVVQFFVNGAIFPGKPGLPLDISGDMILIVDADGVEHVVRKPRANADDHVQIQPPLGDGNDPNLVAGENGEGETMGIEDLEKLAKLWDGDWSQAMASQEHFSEGWLRRMFRTLDHEEDTAREKLRKLISEFKEGLLLKRESGDHNGGDGSGWMDDENAVSDLLHDFQKQVDMLEKSLVLHSSHIRILSKEVERWMRQIGRYELHQISCPKIPSGRGFFGWMVVFGWMLLGSLGAAILAKEIFALVFSSVD
eukprot:TRINITY_DN271_c0_g2_i1.p1 TRINITY_DN271_c0_g2~~TRINITY_DN271_c0_g2_i1.p1  ORF type:complete len:961 (-),score=278.10 TRINITY_DN271_c0_g2_i1:73-2697(-)